MWGKILKSVIVCAVAAFAIGGCDNDLGTDDRGDIQDLLDDLRGISHPTKTTFSDGRDGKTYSKVTIGGQTWMAENLNYDVPDNTTDVCHGNNSSNCATYGRLYNWATAMGIDAAYNSSSWNGSDVNHRGVCPVGWHIPSDAEWSTLVSYVGGSSTAGTKLKATSGWYNAYSYSNGTDDYGFSALPGGDGGSDGYFYDAGYFGFWWSSTEIDA